MKIKLKSGQLTVRPLKNVKYTGELMKKLSFRYQDDVAMFGHYPLLKFYDFVKNIPYKTDPKKQEFLQRPYYTITGRGTGGDCDDKCIVMGAYLALNDIPFRFVACGRNKEGRLHHVVIEAKIDGKWVHIDPTYSFNTFGEKLHNYQKMLVIG
jgi:hypothetical protein